MALLQQLQSSSFVPLAREWSRWRGLREADSLRRCLGFRGWYKVLQLLPT
jgi:hypothetical protein